MCLAYWARLGKGRLAGEDELGKTPDNDDEGQLSLPASFFPRQGQQPFYSKLACSQGLKQYDHLSLMLRGYFPFVTGKTIIKPCGP